MLPSPDDPVLSVADARAALESACPQLAFTRISALGRGWDADAFLLDARWVARFARNGFAAGGFERERVISPWLAPQLPRPIPIAQHAGTFGTHAWPVLVSQYLRGHTVCDLALDQEARLALAAPLAEFVRALHAVSVQALPVALGTDPLGRFDVARRQSRVLEELAALGADDTLPSAVCARLRGWVEQGPPQLAEEPAVLVHADLHTRNLLVDERGALSGVIDWADLHVGERTTDLAAAYEVLPAGARDRFFSLYQECDDSLRARARWRAITHTVAALMGSRQRGDGPLERASRVALCEMAED